jgi:hypothetical protein
MRPRYLVFLTLILTGVIVLSVTHGQDTPAPPAVVPATYTEPVPAVPALSAPASPTPATPTPPAPTRDLAKLTNEQKRAMLAAQRGANWMAAMNGPSCRFCYGCLPALNCLMEGDNFLFQVAAAATLARAARLIADPDIEKRLNAIASGAILKQLDETMVDPKDPNVRYPKPSIVVNRLAAAGLLVAAIHELPSPQADVLVKSEQLCNFIRRQAQPDGSLSISDLGPDGKPLHEEALDAATGQYPGLALYGLMLSQRQRPAAWKTDLVRKALAYYQPWWQANKNPGFIPAQTAAYTEAYLLTKEPAFAAFVLEMNDWLCGLQLETSGGFKNWKDGHEVEEAPTIACAIYGESLANACRVASEVPDVARHPRYKNAVERNVDFLESLQYRLDNTLHFEADYREHVLCGGFHPSEQDGNLRLDYTQQAVATLLQYVDQVR